jgi:3-isopropylmalate/(R)-2-methylmalate dehydratase small subunit
MSLIQGRAWVFGDHINTDVIIAGRYLYSPIPEAARHAFEAVDKTFSEKVKSGDVIVAGKNFGCGSARDAAPLVLKQLGIGCILAEDFARIFFRNAIAIGLPALAVQGISGKVQPLDELSVSLDSGEVFLIRTGEVLKTTPFPPQMRSIIQAGGIDELLLNFKRGGND